MSRRIQYEHIRSKTILNKVKTPAMPFEWSINPYRGCQHGCSFCYARSTHTFLGEEADDAFQNHIFLKENAAELLDEQLRKAASSRKGLNGIGRIAIGTATDPYQPVEAKALLTRQCLEVLAKYQVPTSITTRSPLIARDIDVLRQIPVTSINLSVNTLDTKIWRNMEPTTPSPRQRLETVQQLNEAGLPAGIFMAPILPFLTDGEEALSELIEQAARHQAKFVMASFLRLNTQEVKVWFFQTLREHYPHLIAKYGELYHHSAYAPSSYREPVKNKVQDLLMQHQLDAREPFRFNKRQPTDTQPIEQETGPVQLSFSF